MQLSPRPDSIRRILCLFLLVSTLLAAVRTTLAADVDSEVDRPSTSPADPAPAPEGMAEQLELPKDDATYRASSEVAAYTDSDNVSVLTPSIGFGI